MCELGVETDRLGKKWRIEDDYARREDGAWLRHYGICTSLADWWVHVTDSNLYWYRREHAMAHIHRAHTFHSNTSRGKLFPKCWLGPDLYVIEIPRSARDKFRARLRGDAGLESERLAKAMIDLRLCPIRGIDSLKAPPAVDRFQGIDLIVVTGEGEIGIAVRRDSKADGANLYIETHRRTKNADWHSEPIADGCNALDGIEEPAHRDLFSETELR